MSKRGKLRLNRRKKYLNEGADISGSWKIGGLQQKVWVAAKKLNFSEGRKGGGGWKKTGSQACRLSNRKKIPLPHQREKMRARWR